MAAAIPYIQMAVTAYSAYSSAKGPDIPKEKEPALAPDPDSLEARRQSQRDTRRRQVGGRTSTVLSGSGTLG